jgi:holliday junction DNA helicase RuvA
LALCAPRRLALRYRYRVNKNPGHPQRMYNHIAGILDSKTQTDAVIDAGGIGFLLRIPYSTAAALPDIGKRVRLLAYLHVTDSQHTLFGFLSEAERAFFLQLLEVDGVGPKLALAVLSGGRVEDIQQAIRLGDFASLKRIKGVGEGTAKKIVLQLGKILIHQASAEAPAKASGKAKSALKNGLPAMPSGLDRDIDDAVRAVSQLQEVPNDEALQAVQRAFSELSAAGGDRPAVQDIVQRAMKYTG